MAGRSLVLTKFAPRKFTKKRTYDVLIDSSKWDSAFEETRKGTGTSSKRQKHTENPSNQGQPQQKPTQDPNFSHEMS